MFIIGIDVSKAELVGVKINRRGQIKETYVIGNTEKEISLFLDTLNNKKMVLGCEATAEYHNVLALSCIKRDILFYVLNPIVTKQFVRATVRKKKTDLTDAHVIAKCILQGQGQLADLSCFNHLKPILRTAAELARLKTAVSHMGKRFKDHFKEELFIQDELSKIKEVIEKGMITIRNHGIKQTDQELLRLLCSIPGIGETLAAKLIAEIGDVGRFKSAKSLVAFSGLDPKVRQSGTSLNRNTKLTKRGSPYLRRALYIASSIAQRCDPELKAYYLKKRNEGKRYTEATVANARHILFRVYAVWKRKSPYVVKEA